MGLFGKLFEKKECDICGGEIGLLVNRKLEDGNCCKGCAKKLSPFMTDRRKTTIQEIKQHLQYREENERMLDSINPSHVIGANTKVYVDEEQGKFFVTRYSDWRNNNPDIIDISQVSSCTVDIKEDKSEIYTKNSEGNRESYNPRRYEYAYRFMVEIYVNAQWFSEIKFELSDDRPDSRYSHAYREYERQAQELLLALDPNTNRNHYKKPGVPHQTVQSGVTGAANKSGDGWVCICGETNKGNFCAGCGAKKPIEGRQYRCDKCGWEPDGTANLPKFCPRCGDPFDVDDVE